MSPSSEQPRLAACGALLSPASASAAPATSTDLFYAALKPVSVNHASGSGGVWIALTGDSAKFTLQVDGLLAKAPHPAQVYVGAAAACPTAGQAAAFNGHPSIAYNAASLGSPQVALTTSGDTSAASALAMPRFPTAGNYTYTRTFTVPPSVAAAVKGGKAVLVVHGVDYNGNGKYDDVLGVTPGHSCATGGGYGSRPVRHIRRCTDGEGRARGLRRYRRRLDGGHARHPAN